MGVIVDGHPFVIGVPANILPIRGLPAHCKVRLRLRHDAEGFVFVKTADGIRRHGLDDHGDHWTLGPLLGCNLSVTDR